MVMGEPWVGRGIELPEGAQLEALPSAGGGRRPGRDGRVRQVVCEGPAANRGRIEIKAQAALEFGGDETIGGGWTDAQQLTHERFDIRRPIRGVVTPRGAGDPVGFATFGAGAKVIGVKLVEAGASEFEAASRFGGVKLLATEGGKDLANQRSAVAVGQLAVVFFIGRRMPEAGDAVPRTPWDLSHWTDSGRGRPGRAPSPAGPAVCQTGVGARVASLQSPILRTGERRIDAGKAAWNGGFSRIHLCSHACPGLLAHLSAFARTVFAFARNATHGYQAQK